MSSTNCMTINEKCPNGDTNYLPWQIVTTGRLSVVLSVRPVRTDVVLCFPPENALLGSCRGLVGSSQRFLSNQSFQLKISRWEGGGWIKMRIQGNHTTIQPPAAPIPHSHHKCRISFFHFSYSLPAVRWSTWLLFKVGDLPLLRGGGVVDLPPPGGGGLDGKQDPANPPPRPLWVRPMASKKF